MGRPPLYNTPEQRRTAKRASNRNSKQRKKEQRQLSQATPSSPGPLPASQTHTFLPILRPKGSSLPQFQAVSASQLLPQPTASSQLPPRPTSLPQPTSLSQLAHCPQPVPQPPTSSYTSSSIQVQQPVSSQTHKDTPLQHERARCAAADEMALPNILLREF
ncbi:hypothetical protein K491DRAFT_215768 [Lophiostoma macrostomum CBS 122681]|uniref:Uncharacterized protein n=1 Tax=Lophiostoma macrostomum CBS 122681 TaxID=1314788 RepID=A0A6A6TIR5_9PLEO|nr:hypothetical protein K491DRAFT_215768 [Lophiostoma macrostomum CBS 122681]